MALDLATLKTQVNQTLATDDALLTRLLMAATRHVESLLGYTLPTPLPADLEHAVFMVAAHWYEQREETFVGTIVRTPVGVADIIDEHRNYTFGVSDDDE